MTNPSEWRKLAHVVRLTQPIIGIENRTPLEVFDIMCDRIKRGITSTPSSAPEVSELVERECTIGVGDGGGQLFVHGSYDAIKRVQTMILALEEARAALAKVPHGPH